MLAIFESILPIFLIIVLGNLLRRTSITSDDVTVSCAYAGIVGAKDTWVGNGGLPCHFNV